MNLEILTLASSIVGGALAGGLMGRRFARTTPTPVTTPEEDPLTDTWIERTATDWAVAHGRPYARSVIANKLRLGMALSRRRWPR